MNFLTKILYILILFLPVNLLASGNIPEWEKIELNMDSLSWFGQVEKNSNNELILLLPTGLYKSQNENEKWSRLNIPDSLIFEKTFFQMNGPTIFTYGYTHNSSQSRNYYFVYSNDFGNTWFIIPIKELKFPGYDMSIFLSIDKNGDIRGISSNKQREPSSIVVVNKFDVINNTSTKLFEIPKSYQKILLNESITVLLDFITKPDIETDTTNMKELQVHYSKNGIDWDSLFFNKYNTPDFEKIDGSFSAFTYIFEAKESVYTYLGSQSTSKGSSLKIDLKNRILTILQENVPNSTYIRKVNDSSFYKSESYKSDHFLSSIFKSKDMINWEIFASPYKLDDLPDSVKYIQCDFYSRGYWMIDKYENHYLYNNYGLIKLSNDDKTFSALSREGLINVSINNLAIDSKSNIVIVNRNHNENLIIINPAESTKNIITHNFRIGTTDFFECLVNDTYIFDKYDSKNKNFATYILNDEFSAYYPSQVDDTTRIKFIRNTMSKGKYFLGLSESGSQNNTITKYAYSDDHCQTWKILENIKFKDGIADYQTFINIYSDIIRIEPYSRFNITKDFGENWEVLLDDSTNVLFANHKNSYKIDLINYNEATGTGIVKYQNKGPIYYTIDHGLSWNILDTNLQSFKFLHENITKSKSDYSWVTLPMSFDSTLTFYMNTPLGIFRSNDTLKSFHNISKGLIEPSNIYKFKAGNDGKLYAVNSRGIWRTKENFVNSLEDDVEQFSTNDLELSISPNPASDFITISLSNKGLKPFVTTDKVQIFDVLGIEVMSVVTGLDLSAQKIDVSNLPVGVYFIRIGTRVEKFVKM
jgi:hypothetical protein